MDHGRIHMLQFKLFVNKRRDFFGIFRDRAPQRIIAQLCALHIRSPTQRYMVERPHGRTSER
jgi:hypothetical protein